MNLCKISHAVVSYDAFAMQSIHQGFLSHCLYSANYLQKKSLMNKLLRGPAALTA